MKRVAIGALLIPALAVFIILPCASFAQASNPLKIALIFDMGGRGDDGFNDSAYRGMERAAAELGVKPVYIEHKRNLELDLAANQAAASDANVIIGVGFSFSEKLTGLAERYPDKKFVCIDYAVKYDDKGQIVPLPANLAGLTFKEEEGSYLIGALAALKSKTGKIGFIGGMESPVIQRFHAGYQAGAKAVRPDISILSKHAGITAQAFKDPQKGYRIAKAMYADGADIIYHAAGATGTGLFQAAKEFKFLAIGVDVDQDAMAPGRVLTSMTKHVDVAVYEIVRACAQGYFAGGLNSFGLKENGVGYVYNDRNRTLITEAVHEKVQQLRNKIIEGQLAVPEIELQKPMLSRKVLLDVLSRLNGEITAVLNRIDAALQRSAKALTGRELNGDFARDALKRLYEENPYIIDCETVSDKGLMLVVEPGRHKSSEGADIRSQAHMVKLFKIKKPVLSASFRSVEGPDAVVIHHPVFSREQRFAGSVAALFAPEYLLENIVGPVASNLPIDIILMQKDGLMIYAFHTDRIGRNIFTEPRYQASPEMIAAVRLMVAEEEGSSVFRLNRKGAKTPETRTAYWRTVGLHGTQWRLVITCAKDNIEP